MQVSVKRLTGEDISRILSAVDLTVFAQGLRRLSVDSPSLSRANIMAAVGSAEIFRGLGLGDDPEFAIRGEPASDQTTI